ncbi:YheC/YheD family protein [Sporosarcina jiandibaonis]|uniref:YheC/YheD family endospore coat-associated protein n=1 Tax=Sporosarcina jiandibaonis TaxID=2715535 RepID=UPI001553ABB4|nr:YheC/YheD family protein [Sporosarcina jiandibaonis]
MSTVFKLVSINNNSHCIMLHPNQRKLISETKLATTIHFGLQEMEVTCKFSNTVKETEIGLSNNIIESLQLPLGVDYKISFQNERFIIGPFIGILMNNPLSVINKKGKKLNRIIKQYPSIHGVVVAFSWEGMNLENQTINGFIYNPSSKKWENRTFPYPAVIVKRMKLSAERTNYLKTIYGHRFFNSGSFNKWQMYQLLSSNKKLLPHLPKTVLYNKPEDLINLLNNLGTIYVKPLSGQKGVNIAKFMVKGDQYSVNYRMKNENKTIFFSNENELLNYAKSMFKSKRYILQQEIDLEINKNHLIDFRIVLIKDQSGHWENAGMVGRIGVEGSVVSNRSSGGKVVNGKDLLLSAFNFSEEEMLNYYRKMSAIAIKAAEELDKYENIYKYGVDIGIDCNRHIWIIELNNRSPNDNIFSYVRDYDTVLKIKDSRLYYAKYLAGFPKEKENGESE